MSRAKHFCRLMTLVLNNAIDKWGSQLYLVAQVLRPSQMSRCASMITLCHSQITEVLPEVPAHKEDLAPFGINLDPEEEIEQFCYRKACCVSGIIQNCGVLCVPATFVYGAPLWRTQS